MPINVASAWGLSVPPLPCWSWRPRAVSLFDALDELFERVGAGSASAVFGFAALAQTNGTYPGMFATGIAFDPTRLASGALLLGGILLAAPSRCTENRAWTLPPSCTTSCAVKRRSSRSAASLPCPRARR